MTSPKQQCLSVISPKAHPVFDRKWVIVVEHLLPPASSHQYAHTFVRSACSWAESNKRWGEGEPHALSHYLQGYIEGLSANGKHSIAERGGVGWGGEC